MMDMIGDAFDPLSCWLLGSVTVVCWSSGVLHSRGARHLTFTCRWYSTRIPHSLTISHDDTVSPLRKVAEAHVFSENMESPGATNLREKVPVALLDWWHHASTSILVSKIGYLSIFKLHDTARARTKSYVYHLSLSSVHTIRRLDDLERRLSSHAYRRYIISRRENCGHLHINIYRTPLLFLLQSPQNIQYCKAKSPYQSRFNLKKIVLPFSREHLANVSKRSQSVLRREPQKKHKRGCYVPSIH